MASADGSVNEFTDGLKAIPRGVALIFRKPSRILSALAPVVIFLLLLSATAGPLLSWLEGTLRPWFASFLSPSWDWIASLAVWLAGAVSGLVLFLMCYALTRLLAGVFLSWIAESVLIEKKIVPAREWNEQIALLIRMAVVSAFKAVLFLVISLVLFVMSFVPLLNVAVLFGLVLIVCFDSLDYSFEARGFSLTERFSWFGRRQKAVAGLACGWALLLFLPVINVLVFPFAVAGAADLMARLETRSERR